MLARLHSQTLCVYLFAVLCVYLLITFSRGNPLDHLWHIPRVGSSHSIPLKVPNYVIKYAPLLHLHSQEAYLPSDINEHLQHVHPYTTNHRRLNASQNRIVTVGLVQDDWTLGVSASWPDPWAQLNRYRNKSVEIFLTANESVFNDPGPEWLYGIRPDNRGWVKLKDLSLAERTRSALTCAVIIAPKIDSQGKKVVDAFWHLFYSLNWGGIVDGKNMGNHIADWEHVMVRFIDSRPEYVWLSQHSGGQAFRYSDMQKDSSGLRPIVFVANGSHANYAITGAHDHTTSSFGQPNRGVPGLLTDWTDQGPIYDPYLSSNFYSWAADEENVGGNAASDEDSEKDIGILHEIGLGKTEGFLKFRGLWGNEYLPEKDPRQITVGDFHKWESGPRGPAWKNLGRRNVWTGNYEQKIQDGLVP